MDILVNVVGQRLRIATNQKRLVSGTQNFIRFVFNFSDDWYNMMIFCQFTQNGKSYYKYLDGDNAVYLPAEITDGECEIMLYGSQGDRIGLTASAFLALDRNILSNSPQATEITQSLYNQLVTIVNQTKNDVSSKVGWVRVSGSKLQLFRDSSMSQMIQEITLPSGGGNVTPITKTADMTQEVGIDSNGKLWTKPGSSGTISGDQKITISDGTDIFTITIG